jgi:hypothetical protein
MSIFIFLGSPHSQGKVKPFLGWDLIILETLEALQFRLIRIQLLDEVCPFALTPEPTPLLLHDFGYPFRGGFPLRVETH